MQTTPAARLDPDLDGIENIEEYQMEEWFADPYTQDIYYEVDCMGRGGLFDPPHYFPEESKQAVIERFSEHNIQVFFDDGWPDGPINGGGQVLPHIIKVSQESGMVLQFYEHYFPEERKGIFRYLIVNHRGGFQHPAENNVYDVTSITVLDDGVHIIQQIKDFVILGVIPTQRGYDVSFAGLLLHEMAHSCGVSTQSCGFAGIDNTSGPPYLFRKFMKQQYVQTWGQYKSVLNYLYTNGGKIVDLSNGENGPPYDQNDWGMMFCADFEYSGAYIEESTPTPPDPDTMKLVDSEWVVTGYIYDANLTEKFVKYIGDYSPVDPIEVKWVVYKLTDKEKNPNYADIRVYVHPDIKNTQQWVLYQTGDLDPEGNLQFYSYDDILNEVLKERKT